MHGSTKYVCDKWISWDADATFGSGYITPGSPIDQNLSKTVVDINKTYTAAICLSDGTIKADSGTFSNGFGSYALGIYCMKQTDSNAYVTVRLSEGNNIRWTALYEGAYTVDTLPPYIPKGKHVEMLNCSVPLTPHNLLDNSDFRNPVNQRGITSQIGGGYGLDRWRADGAGTITVGSTGVSITNLSFRQPVQLKAGTYTLAFKVSNGTILYYNFTYDGASTITKIGGANETTGAYINLYNQSNGVVVCQFVLGPEYTYTLVWAALYEGAYDASTLPAYQPKGYAAELAECQRYFTRVSNSAAYGIISGTGCVVKVPLPMTMRKDIVPTVTLDSAAWAYTHEGYVGLTFIGTIYSTNTASLHFTLGTETSARCCVVPDLSFNISADL